MAEKNVTKALARMARLSKGLKELLEQKGTLSRRVLKKGDALLMPRMQANEAYFLDSGLCKFLYKNDDNEEEIFMFGLPGEIILLPTEFFKDRANEDVHIIMVEDTVLYCITKVQMDEIYKLYEEAHVLTEIIVTGIEGKIKRHTQMVMKKAGLRYNLYATLFPELKGKLGDKDICAFLGIGRSTLSRFKR